MGIRKEISICCGKEKVANYTDEGTGCYLCQGCLGEFIPQPDKEAKVCEPNDLIYTSNPPQNKCKNCGKFWFCKDKRPVCHSPSQNIEKEDISKNLNKTDISEPKYQLKQHVPPDSEEEWGKEFLDKWDENIEDGGFCDEAEAQRYANSGQKFEEVKAYISILLKAEREKAHKEGYMSALDEKYSLPMARIISATKTLSLTAYKKSIVEKISKKKYIEAAFDSCTLMWKKRMNRLLDEVLETIEVEFKNQFKNND